MNLASWQQAESQRQHPSKFSLGKFVEHVEQRSRARQTNTWEHKIQNQPYRCRRETLPTSQTFIPSTSSRASARGGRRQAAQAPEGEGTVFLGHSHPCDAEQQREVAATPPCEPKLEWTTCDHPHRSYPISERPTRRDEQLGSLVTHPHRVAWLASKGLTSLTVTLDSDDEDDDWWIELDEIYEPNTDKIEVGETRPRRIENPFKVDMLDKLALMPPSRLLEYLGKIRHVEQEIAIATRQNKPLTHIELQHILNETADLGHGLIILLPSTRVGLLNAHLSASDLQVIFEYRAAGILKEILAGQREVQPQDATVRSHAKAVILVLQQHAKCIRILQLLSQLKHKETWTYGPLRSLVVELWPLPIERLSIRLEELLPLYDLARATARLAPEQAAFLMGSMPEDVRRYAVLFLTTDNNVQLIRDVLAPIPLRDR